MARRSDHSPIELRTLLIEAGHGLIEERGFARFSAREAARRAGYTVGTIYHVFGSLDPYFMAINTSTNVLWTGALEQALADCPADGDRIAVLVGAYFAFAEAHPNAWQALYDYRQPADLPLPEADVAERVKLTGIVDKEVARELGREIDADTRRLTRSLIATAHGHCALHLSGNFALMQETDPLGQAIARVRESLAAIGSSSS